MIRKDVVFDVHKVYQPKDVQRKDEVVICDESCFPITKAYEIEKKPKCLSEDI